MPAEPPARRRGPGRPPVIDRERIVAEAMELAAEQGAGAVTMSAVAKRLGVAMPALYYHVRNVDDLLGLVAAQLFRQMPLPDVRLRWDRWLAAFARELRTLLQREPLLTRVPYLAVHQPFPAAVTERALRVMTRDGFAGIDALLAFGVFVRWVVDGVHAESAQVEEILNGRHPLRVMRDRAEQAAEEDVPVLRAVLDELAAVPDDLSGWHDALFAWHLDMELAGLEALRAGRARPVPRPPRRRAP